MSCGPLHLTTILLTGAPPYSSDVQQPMRAKAAQGKHPHTHHVALSDSYFTPRSQGFVFDPYHLNSVAFDHGNPIISMRNTSAVYEVDRNTGKVLWTLGGKHSSFRMGAGAGTVFQHAAALQPDGTITVFDDGGGPPRAHKYSRGVRLSLVPLYATPAMPVALLTSAAAMPARAVPWPFGSESGLPVVTPFKLL